MSQRRNRNNFGPRRPLAPLLAGDSILAPANKSVVDVLGRPPARRAPLRQTGDTCARLERAVAGRRGAARRCHSSDQLASLMVCRVKVARGLPAGRSLAALVFSRAACGHAPAPLGATPRGRGDDPRLVSRRCRCHAASDKAKAKPNQTKLRRLSNFLLRPLRADPRRQSRQVAASPNSAGRTRRENNCPRRAQVLWSGRIWPPTRGGGGGLSASTKTPLWPFNGQVLRLCGGARRAKVTWQRRQRRTRQTNRGKSRAIDSPSLAPAPEHTKRRRI